MKFTKLQGAGNDFILINGFVEKSDNWNETAKKVCDRHFGIGADGMIFCSESKIADVKMNFYNSDGTRAEMCGNGIRCFTKFVYDEKIVDKKEIAVETDAGIKVVKLQCNDKDEVVNLEVELNKMIFKASDVPCLASKEEALEEKIIVDGKEIVFSSVLVGVPHTVVFLDDFTNVDIEDLGRKIENNPVFPRKTNVNFVKVIDDNTLQIKTWERGAGRTLGCGTGSSSSAGVAHRLGKMKGNKIKTISDGGVLFVEVKDDYSLVLSGKAETICRGEFLK